MDVDPYLTTTATARIASLGMFPRMITCDATGPLPGKFDRTVSLLALARMNVTVTPDGVCHFTRGRWSADYG
ncbi:hypothetical protein [Streptomyces sp. NPDC051576]|uniref:hypothetical protein n=1 Tax=Streptomyces sp. NPDC051576 TaxID=3155803 RepID=UPI003447AC43